MTAIRTTSAFLLASIILLVLPGVVAAGPVDDTIPPQTTITSGPASGQTVGQSEFTFEFDSDEAGSTFECAVDDGAFAACTSPLTVPGLAGGEHELAVRAIDPAGNIDPTPARRSARVADCAGAQADLENAKAKAKKAKKKLNRVKGKGKPKKVKKANKKLKKARADVETANIGVEFAC